MLGGEAVTVDGVVLKEQNRHFYDFTLHHVEIKKGRTVLEQPEFNITATTILFVGGPEVSTAANLRRSLSDFIILTYGVNFDCIKKHLLLLRKVLL